MDAPGIPPVSGISRPIVPTKAVLNLESMILIDFKLVL